MARKAPQLAKLTRPRLHKAVARERLFALLDEPRSHRPAICVVGPPGAGKTTLVASWLDARDIKGIWYQVDPGDADLATFFYYLGEAARPFTRKGQRPLPLLTPEYLADVPGFSRRYFRELFSRLPVGSTLVLDNYQEVPAEQTFHELIAGAIAEVPLGITLVCVSRRDPPECYARLMANDRVVLIDWDDLKLTLEEACAMGQLRHQLSRDEVAQLHERCDGWAAGLVLLLERLRRGRGFEAASTDSLREVFNYFAAQLVEQFDASAQKALMQMSYLPRMTAATAVAMTGMTSAAPLLEELHRRHLFIDHRTAHEPVYQFHALFQAFLQYLADQAMSAGERTEAALRAAHVLEETGHPEEAFPLALKGGDLSAAVAITVCHAARFIGQGRWRVVVDWIKALPSEIVQSHCWLLDWLGTALIAVDAPQARDILEKSFYIAGRAADDMCEVQAAAGMIQTYILEYTHFRPMDRWIDELRSKLKGAMVFPNADAELRAQSALLIGLMYRRPDDSCAIDCARETFRLLNSEAGVNLRTTSASYLSAYGYWTGLDVARGALPILDELVSHPEVTESVAGWGLFTSAFCHMVDCKEKQSREALEALKGLGVDHGMPAMVRLAAIIGTWLELGAGKLSVAQEWANVLKKVMVPGHPYDEASFEDVTAWLAAHNGDAEAAERPIERAVDLYDEAGTHIHRCFSRAQHVVVCTLLGKITEAEQRVSEALDLAGAMPNTWLEVEVRLAASLLALERNRVSTAHENLRRLFCIAKQGDYIWPFKFFRKWASRLCEEALNAEIEVDFVRKVIRELGLIPSSACIQIWPWPIKISTLGEFCLLVDDQPLQFGRKAPRRLLRILKALVALGGREVPMETLTDALWTEAEADSGLEACEKALHRLRSLLKSSEAIAIEDGRVSLNESVVWTDVRGFEYALSSAEASEDRLQSVLELYRGEFLADEPDAAWAVATRERLRGKFVTRIEAAGKALESAERWVDAKALYLKGLDSDSLSETFYQGLMRCYAALGDRAEALSVYRRMRQQLSVVLGVRPSSQSEQLAQTLRLQ